MSLLRVLAPANDLLETCRSRWHAEKWTFANHRTRPLLLENSVREIERAALQKSTSQIDPGSTIETSARVK